MEHLLNELNNAGIKIRIESPRVSYNDQWEVSLSKDDAGTALYINEKGEDVLDALQGAYDKWLSATGRGIPALTLRQIEGDIL